jgi:serine/threonine protein kinase
MPPEVIKKVGHGKPVDMWCVGVLTYFLLSGYMPFEPLDSNDAKEIQNILDVKYDYNDPIWDEVSDQAKDFIQKLLVFEPSQRMTASDALNHPWLQEASSSLTMSPETEIPLLDTPLQETPVYNTPLTASFIKLPNLSANLLPAVKERFNARKQFKKVVDVVKAIHKMSPHASVAALDPKKLNDSPAPSEPNVSSSEIGK